MGNRSEALVYLCVYVGNFSLFSVLGRPSKFDLQVAEIIKLKV